MNQQHHQQQRSGGPHVEPPRPAAITGENIYYLMPADEHEQALCMAWIEKHKPGTVARNVSRLRVDRLTERHSVIVLMRRVKKPTPVIGVVRDEHNLKELVVRSPEFLVDDKPIMDQVSEGPPVHAGKHWKPAPDGEDGLLNESSFLEELGKTCSPLAIKWRSDDRVVWLGFA